MGRFVERIFSNYQRRSEEHPIYTFCLLKMRESALILQHSVYSPVKWIPPTYFILTKRQPAPPLILEVPLEIKELDALIRLAVSNRDGAVRGHGDVVRQREIAGFRPFLSPRLQQIPCGGKPMHPVLTIPI